MNQTSLKLMAWVTVLATTAPVRAQPAADQRGSEEIRATGESAPRRDVSPGAPPTGNAGTDEATADGRSPIDGVVGHLGLGYFTGFAPVGVRYWFDRESAFDFGLDAAFSTGNLKVNRYGIEIGYVMALAHYHYSLVFTRLGLGFRFLDSFGENSTPAEYSANGSVFVGAELFLGAFGFPNVSLQGGYGIEAEYNYFGGSAFQIGTVNGGLSVVSAGTVGFHIYL
ncbi:MAG: hypothetical protein V3T05_03610 [Myxococcota bacterium]